MTKESGGAVEMSNHQATEQMLGYLYQVRYALALLLDNSDPNCQISIEKFCSYTETQYFNDRR